MIGEIWTFRATQPNDGTTKERPVLIVGNDSNNQLQFVDLHYVIISSSADCGIFDIRLDNHTAHSIGLKKESVIKTTKIFTGPRTKMGQKIGVLPPNIKLEFIKKYRAYQESLIANFESADIQEEVYQ